ncbi:MAG: glycyl-radical enzyme activating protein [Anaerolineales bacterium]|nr:glycyl-radical enzyme activating protein [Anaerolineales bacterium]
MPDSLTGRILHLQRLSTEDGPGIRTTVFFKGCPLHCAWCHNPESISSLLQVQWHADRCLECLTCLNVCPRGCLTMTRAGMEIDRVRCSRCGKCAEACPANALEMLGRQVTVDELLPELLKDRAYYLASGGGVTLSGGEPLLQMDFVEALLRGLKEAGIHTALDTCGQAQAANLVRLLPYVDLVLYDVKLADAGAHQKYTGLPNQKILANLLVLRDALRDGGLGVELWVRTPLIPGATAGAANLAAIGRFLAEHLDGCLARWELCAFNNLARDKYSRLDQDWAYAGQALMTSAELAACEQAARAHFPDPQIVLASGPTRPPED